LLFCNHTEDHRRAVDAIGGSSYGGTEKVEARGPGRKTVCYDRML
jgi:hypothetical protein